MKSYIKGFPLKMRYQNFNFTTCSLQRRPTTFQEILIERESMEKFKADQVVAYIYNS